MAEPDLTTPDGRVQYLIQHFGLTPAQAADLASQFEVPQAPGGVPEGNSDVISGYLDDFVASKGLSAQGSTPLQKTTSSSPATVNQEALSVQKAASSAAAKAVTDPAGAMKDLLAFASAAGTGSVPSQVLQLTHGVSLTPQQITTAIAQYNAMNPSDRLADGDVDGLYQRISFGAPGALDALGVAMEGQDTNHTTYSIWDSSGKAMKKVTVVTDQVNAAASAGAKMLPESIAAADRLGGEVPWQIVAAGVSLQDKSGMLPVKGVGNSSSPASGDAFSNALSNALGKGTADQTAQKLQAALRTYGDYGLALISLKDPTLADAIYQRGYVASSETQKTNQILMDAGYDPKTMAAQGLAVDLSKYNAITDSSAGNQSYTLPDPAKLQDAARTLYQAWFSREATDAELSQFVSAIDSKVVAQNAPLNPFKGQTQHVSTEIDPQSDLQSQLRNSAEYGQLFGQKPIGVSELDYANQFRGAAAGMLGGALGNPDAIRVGMQTGNIEDTIRSQFGDAQSQNNSTYMQRLARSAQAVAQVT